MFTKPPSRFALHLEAIGDDWACVEAAKRRFLRAIMSPKEFQTLIGGACARRPWVARIIGPDSRFGYERKFVDGVKSYARANSVGSRGVMLTYLLPPGIFEVHELTSWSRSRRYFLSVDYDGAGREVTKDEVDDCLLAVD